MNIKKLLSEHRINFTSAAGFEEDLGLKLTPSAAEYLSCMGNAVALHITPNGSAYTLLYSVRDIKEEQHPICTANNLLIIGNGLNGDLLAINLANDNVGYVFHDDLEEENFDELADIYAELPFGIERFLEMALSGGDYPKDGYDAENYSDK